VRGDVLGWLRDDWSYPLRVEKLADKGVYADDTVQRFGCNDASDESV
jgi:hypothetical protein